MNTTTKITSLTIILASVALAVALRIGGAAAQRDEKVLISIANEPATTAQPRAPAKGVAAAAAAVLPNPVPTPMKRSLAEHKKKRSPAKYKKKRSPAKYKKKLSPAEYQKKLDELTDLGPGPIRLHSDCSGSNGMRTCEECEAIINNRVNKAKRNVRPILPERGSPKKPVKAAGRNRGR